MVQAVHHKNRLALLPQDGQREQAYESFEQGFKAHLFPKAKGTMVPYASYSKPSSPCIPTYSTVEVCGYEFTFSGTHF